MHGLRLTRRGRAAARLLVDAVIAAILGCVWLILIIAITAILAT